MYSLSPKKHAHARALNTHTHTHDFACIVREVIESIHISQKPILDNKTLHSIIVSEDLKEKNISRCTSGLYDSAKSFQYQPRPPPWCKSQ